jgi:DNA mismatch repair protein MutL
MSRIQKLDPSLINKIAAGEVIERPASVVKELLENAIDAGATRIDVALEDGGTKLIRVTDNGYGMAPDDLPLAVAPHATSKIALIDDLFHVRSLGFRGEALASIAAVSHLRICSRPAEQLEAYELLADDGRLDGPRACAAPAGTTIEVRNLFHNVPARRKFLRQAATELANATEQLARLALAHPSIAFTLTNNGRPARNLPATADRRTRIADFYGSDLADCLFAAHRDERDCRIDALLAPPAQARASSKWQYLFLNGRYIVDRRVNFAVREAFRGLIEHDRYPVVFIFLAVDPAQFDVNVHPTKIEVRWRDAGLIQSQVLSLLRETLLSHDLTPALRMPSSGFSTGGPPRDDFDRQERTREALVDYLKAVDPAQARLRFQPPPFPKENLRPSISTTFHREETPRPPSHRGADLPVGRFSPTPDAHNPAPLLPGQPAPTTPADESAQPSDLASAASGLLESLAGGVIQVHNTYLVAQTDEGIIIVDQHALHERILYERFREQLLAGPLESQRLLIPQAIEVSPRQEQAAHENHELLAKLGIEVSTFGPGAVGVQSFPAMLPHVDIHAFVSDLLDKLAESDEPPSEEAHMHKALDMMACKAAVKAGDPLSTEEMQALLSQRHLVQRSSNCPHGRPTTLQLSTRDLERQFRRV